MLLEVAVYPYLICSLMHGLGSLAPAQAWRLFCSGWKFYVALWLITFGLLILLAKGIPQALATSWVADRAVKDAPGLLDILIPSDPFTALSRNYVPAVVLFCLFYGVALQHVPEKAALLSILEGIRLASLKFWNAVVRFAPLAVFALFVDLAGTIRLKAMEEVALFFFLFFAGALLLTFWIIPGCIAAFAPLQRKEVLRKMRSALLIVVATTLSVSALPYISSATQRLAQACGVDDPECGEIVRTSISVAYPLGQLGNFFVYLFVVFALFLNGVIVPPLETWLCANRYFPFVHWVAHFVRRCGNLPGTLAWSARSNDASLRQPDDLDTLWSGHRLGQRFRFSEFWRGAGVLREDSHSLVAPFVLPGCGPHRLGRIRLGRSQLRSASVETRVESLPFLPTRPRCHARRERLFAALDSAERFRRD
jgi:Sodium:dicarboxylate symporter family